MGKRRLLIILVGLLAAIVGSTTNAADPVKSEDLRKELLRRMREDQEARNAVMALFQSGKIGSLDKLLKEGHPLANQFLGVDRRNTTRLKEIIDEYGWPGKSLVGADGAHAAWLLVQHADHDVPFQKQCLPLLEKAVKDGEASGQDFAYLMDRVRVASNEKQVYGTQFRPLNGKLVPLPIEDESQVDQRRKEVGLGSLAEYLRESEEAYAPELKAKPKAQSSPED